MREAVRRLSLTSLQFPVPSLIFKLKFSVGFHSMLPTRLLPRPPRQHSLAFIYRNFGFRRLYERMRRTEAGTLRNIVLKTYIHISNNTFSSTNYKVVVTLLSIYLESAQTFFRGNFVVGDQEKNK